MKEPKVHLLAKTVLEPGALNNPNMDTGQGWKSKDSPSDGENLIEFLGRLCYQSFGIGINPNVTRVREGNDVYISNVVASEHGSLFEHVSMTFLIENCTRVFSHELVRHRAGTAFSQESLRYVRTNPFEVFQPPMVERYGLSSFFNKITKYLNQELGDIQEKIFGEKMDFFEKKKITSMLRRLIPMGMQTTIGFTANLRALRHIIVLRTSEHAEEEMRLIFNQIALICKEQYPNVFADLVGVEKDGYLEYTTDHPKI